MIPLKDQNVMNFLQDFAESLFVIRGELETDKERLVLERAIRAFLRTSFSHEIDFFGVDRHASWRTTFGMRLKPTHASFDSDSFWEVATGQKR